MAMPQVIIKAPGTHVLLAPRHQDFPGRLGLGAMETGHHSSRLASSIFTIFRKLLAA